MFRGKDIKRYLDSIITAIDSGKSPKRATPRWVRRVAGPAAVGLTLGIAGCATEAPDEVDLSKDSAADAKADGFTDALCLFIGAEEGCDLCQELGWYGDGECDDFCEQEDVLDCGGVPEYAVPFEICGDGEDNDYDGDVDCDDEDCALDPGCIPTVRYMALFERCDDGGDNDSDGLVDCDDPDCADDPACAVTPRYMALFEDCGDGVDNDGDGDVDCADEDCALDPGCVPTPRYMALFEVCDDEGDNDGDGLVDCDDPDCEDDPACAATPRYMAPFE